MQNHLLWRIERTDVGKIDWEMKVRNLGRLDIFGSVFTIPSRPDGKKRGVQFGMKTGAHF
ncbi:hypothetical protein ASE74_02200 [Pedobacter sp. Leaf216]|nr:hypothetical protein ASE74_02200 [Pedobacter sp. Leaf216]